MKSNFLITQKKHFAYAVAILAIVSSVALWTGLITSRYISRNLAQSYIQEHGKLRNIEPANTASLLEHASDPWALEERYILSVPSINLRTAVYVPSSTFWDHKTWDMLEEQMQLGLLKGAVAYPHSADPGSVGSLIIAGHSSPPDARSKGSNYGTVFKRLPEVQRGETISILSEHGYVDYIVQSTDIVSPTETSILEQPQAESMLKLITCYPIGTTKDRWVITAQQVKKG